MLVNAKVAEFSSLFSCVKRSAKIYLRNLGWQNLRVRSEGDTARIELSPYKIKDFVSTTDLPTLVSAFLNWAFIYVTLDLEGYRSGKL
ncbi:MAG: ATP-dependent sacrificial sulfur transferase LarE, partial [Cyanobacteriota bacterium]